MVDDVKTMDMASGSLTIMGMAVTVTVKCQFFERLFLCYRFRFVDLIKCSISNAYYIGSLITTIASSRCIYLLLQLLAKKAIKESKICHNFKTKHFTNKSHIEIIDNCILCL